MQRSGASATCLAVSLEDVPSASSPSQSSMTSSKDETDNQAWESAIFFQVGGPESKEDRRRLRSSNKPVSVAIETDLISHAKAGVVVLRLEVYTRPDDPLVGEVLFVPGEHKSHFEALDLLSRQPRLSWFFGDESFHVLKIQQFLMSTEEHSAFSEILSNTLRHDALLRMTTGYDAKAALTEVVSRYEMRAATEQADYVAPDQNSDKTQN